jgi:hypothetical protein
MHQTLIVTFVDSALRGFRELVGDVAKLNFEAI